MNFNESIKSRCPPVVTYFDYIPRNSNYDIYVLVLFTINVFIAIFATCTNFITMLTILKTKTLQTPSNILLGLAISDFFAGVFSVPFFCMYKFSEYLRNLEVYCLSGVGYLVTGTTMGMVSFGTLTAITADRFLAVYLHLRYKEFVTNKLYSVILVLLWIISMIGITLRMLLFDFYFLLFTVVLFLTMLLLNGVFIFHITKVIRCHRHQINAQMTSHQNSFDMPKFKKSVNTMYCIVIAFAVCYLPFGFCMVLMAIKKDIGLFSRTIFSIGETAFLLNSALNPMIYCWRMKEIRNTSVRLLKSVFSLSTGQGSSVM